MPLKINRDEQSSINLTPLIDIVFLLIIFFMVGSKFSDLSEMEKTIPLQVPTVSNAKALTVAPRKRVINVVESGEIILDEEPVSLDQLYNELAIAREQFKDLAVVIRGDGQTMYQRIADVIAICQRAEINGVNISVRQIASTAGLPTQNTSR